MQSITANTNQSFSISIDLNTSPETAWLAWTDANTLIKWLCEKANVGHNVGDAYELFWEPDHPERNSTIGCSINTSEPNKLLGFNWKGPVPFADLMNVEPLPTSVNVELVQIDNSHTRIVLTHSGWGAGTRWDEARIWQQNAWSGALEQLEKLQANPGNI